MHSKTKLNLGSGEKPMEDCVNVDMTARTHPDVVHDLNAIPWPFEDNQFEEVLAYDVVEHLDSMLSFMSETHRVCRPGATVKITTPHFSSANSFVDPTHTRHLSVRSFDYFTGDNEWGFYLDKRFAKRQVNLVFYPTVVNKLVTRLANRYPEAYEQRWAWMFPAWFIYAELTVDKSRA